MVAAGYKWLTPTRDRLRRDPPRVVVAAAGVRELVWRRSAVGFPLRPARLSASARRFDTSPPWQLVEAAAVALEFLASLDIRETHAYSVGLANEFRAAMGMAPGASTIVAVDGADAHALADVGIRASARGGRARLAFYLYNDERDVRAAAMALGARLPVSV